MWRKHRRLIIVGILLVLILILVVVIKVTSKSQKEKTWSDYATEYDESQKVQKPERGGGINLPTENPFSKGIEEENSATATPSASTETPKDDKSEEDSKKQDDSTTPYYGDQPTEEELREKFGDEWYLYDPYYVPQEGDPIIDETEDGG